MAGAATVLGLMRSLGRYRFRGKGLYDLVIFSSISAPELVLGASLLSLFVTTQFTRGFVTIVIAHVAFSLAFVAVTVRARVLGLDPTLEEAAQDLGADPWTTFRKITLPLLAPGIVAGALLAFALSIDDYVVTSFVNGQVETFPIWVYGATRVGVPPQVNVMGTLIFLGGVAIAVGNALLARRQAAFAEVVTPLLAATKPIYYLNAGLHSPEMGSPEMVMELAYRLAVSDEPAIRRIPEIRYAGLWIQLFVRIENQGGERTQLVTVFAADDQYMEIQGGTLLRGGKGRIWGTVAGALILEVIANLMVLSNMVSEYLVAAVQGVIIILAMLAHRFIK